MQNIKKLFVSAAAGIISLSALIMPVSAQNISADMPFPIAIQQDEKSGAEFQRNAYLPAFARWCDYPWNRGNETDNTVGMAACALFSTINNVYYHTGEVIEPVVVAQYALDKGFRRVGVEGVALDYFSAFPKDFGSEFGMVCCGGTSSAQTALAHVRNGGSTSSNVYGHWVTIADYDEENDLYLVLDSAQTCKRCENIQWTDRENGVAWLPPDVLLQKGASGNYGIEGRYSVLYTFDYEFKAEMGDANSDERVDIADASLILSIYSFSASGIEPPRCHAHPARNQLGQTAADINGDLIIDIDDATIVLEKYAAEAAGISSAHQ